MKNFQSKNISDQIASILIEKIIKMELKPGDRLLEAKLKSEFDVSQTTIREAIRILDNYGLVNILPRRGTVISGFSISDVDWMYDILTEMYGLIAEKIILMKNFPPEIIRETMINVQRLSESADLNDVDGYYEAIFDLAVIALKVLESELLKKIIMDMWPAKRRIEYLTFSKRKDRLKDNYNLFTPILGHVKSQDTEMAVKMIKEYTQNEKNIAREIIKAYLEETKGSTSNT